MDATTLFRELKGDLSLRRFAGVIGIGKSTLGLILSGQREPSRKVLRKVADAFPEKKDEITRVFFDGNGHNNGHADAIQDGTA